MSDISTRFYNLLFPSFRNIGATIKGSMNRKERYGKYYYEALKGVLDRSCWTRKQLEDYQSEKLCKIVTIAANNVPYYRNLFKELGLSPHDIRTVEDLKKLPILEKSLFRENPLLFVNEKLNHRDLLNETTSGTTGTPVKVFKSLRTQQVNYAYFEGRSRRLAGMHYSEEPYIMFGAKHVAPLEREKPPFWCYDYISKQLYMSVYHLAPQYLRHYTEEIKRRPYKAIIGYPSVISTLGSFILDEDIHDIKIPIVITNGETLYSNQKDVIEKAFSCQIYDQYGCSELSLFAADCQYGKKHISIDYGIAEIVDDRGEALPPGQKGHLVCTGLINEEQILMRYRVGDTASWSNESCECGSPLPTLNSIDGRTSHAIILPDGRKIFRVNTIVEDVPFINECQIVQKEIGKFIIYVVTSNGFSECDSEKIKRNLAANVGEADIFVKKVSNIERGPGGKFHFIISEVS
jgi:phenylacetate-CoA ligase